VWEYDTSGAVFRVERYGLDYAGFEGTPLDDDPVQLALDLKVMDGGQLNLTGPAPRSVQLVSLGVGAPPTEYALQVTAGSSVGWLRWMDRQGRTDIMADGASAEWRPMSEWEGLRVCGLEPGTTYTFEMQSRESGGPESALEAIGTYTSNEACDVNRSGGMRPVRGSDVAYVRQAWVTGATLGVDQAWACDVNDDGVVDEQDMFDTVAALQTPTASAAQTPASMVVVTAAGSPPAGEPDQDGLAALALYDLLSRAEDGSETDAATSVLTTRWAEPWEYAGI
ncbi:hypothetical protein HQ560_11455, partial [bacterium]|nr:hypothetical protein [bacterium]